MSSLLAWARFAAGVACAGTAVVMAAVHVPRAVHSMNAQVRSDAYITSAEERVLTSGDGMGVSFDLQVEALRLVPKRATYAVVVPADPQVANDKYGLTPVTEGILLPWFQYLLLPAQPVSDPTQAQYIVCWGCDRSFWDKRTKWLWDGGNGQSIGRVVR